MHKEEDPDKEYTKVLTIPNLHRAPNFANVEEN